MPFYDHECDFCGYIWEDFYSMVDDPPTTCPSCNTTGKVKRLISNNIAVRVALHGQELKDKINEDRKKMSREVAKDENLRANIMGEDKYHQDQIRSKELDDNLKQL